MLVKPFKILKHIIKSAFKRLNSNDSKRSTGICMYTVSQKNDTGLGCYIFDVHLPISIIFGRNVAMKLRAQRSATCMGSIYLLYFLCITVTYQIEYLQVIIWLEARLRPNVGLFLLSDLVVRFGGVHSFGYNSAVSEPIWMQSGAL